MYAMTAFLSLWSEIINSTLWRVYRWKEKRKFEISRSMFCRGEFLTQFWRLGGTECDAGKKGENSHCFGAQQEKALAKGFSCCCWSLLYSAVLRSRANSLRSHLILHEWTAFYSAFLNIRWSGVLTALAWLVPNETAAVSAQVLWTPYNHSPCHFMQLSHLRKVYACLAVTCHLHFGQNDQDLLRATAVTRARNGYRSCNTRNAKHPCG